MTLLEMKEICSEYSMLNMDDHPSVNVNSNIFDNGSDILIGVDNSTRYNTKEENWDIVFFTDIVKGRTVNYFTRKTFKKKLKIIKKWEFIREIKTFVEKLTLAEKEYKKDIIEKRKQELEKDFSKE